MCSPLPLATGDAGGSKTRTAHCCCGGLRMTVSGEPERVIACHCAYCQRRTGNPFQVSCWYFGDQVVSRSGEARLYRGPENPGVDYTFCPHCGSTVYWRLPVLEAAAGQALYGIAVGCFVDPDFPAPDLETCTARRHHWLRDVPDADRYDAFPPPERMLPRRPDGAR